MHDLVWTQAAGPLGDTRLEVPPDRSWRSVSVEYSLDLPTIVTASALRLRISRIPSGVVTESDF